MNIVVKFPTKNRPDKFLRVLKMYVDSCADPSHIFYLVSIDNEDDSMSQAVLTQAVQITGPENIQIVRADSRNKIDACNRDINKLDLEWDVIILASDDMNPVVKEWDRIIAEEMRQHYPDTDGALWFYDGHQRRICTMVIIGRKRYEQFGYLYHPSYISLWCDNEFTDVSQRDGKIRYYPVCLFKHDHPMWMGQPDKMDRLYRHNETFFKTDKRNYLDRKKQGFPA